MNLILWVIFGAIIGWLAAIFKGINGTPAGHTILLIGVLAAIIGGAAANVILHSSLNHFSIYSLISAVFVSMLAVWLWKTNDRE